MQCHTKPVGHAVVVSIEGEFDLHHADVFKELLDKQLLADSNLRDIVLDIAQTSFIDSSGLGAILGRYRIIQARRGKLLFVGARPQVRRVLELSGFKKIAVFCQSLEQALQYS